MPLSATTLARLGVPVAKAQQHLPYLVAAMRRYGITSQRRAECFLAQLLHESAMLHYFEELASGAAYEGRRDLGNVRPGDGVRYKGRGPIQLTGRANYRRAGAALKVDFEGHPQLVATPRYGYLVAGWFWSQHGLNTFADSGDFEGITRRINGAATWDAPSYHGRRVELRKRIARYDVRPGQPARKPDLAQPVAHGRPASATIIAAAERADTQYGNAVAALLQHGQALELTVGSASGSAGNGRPNGTLTKLGSQLQTHDARGDALRALLTDRVRTLEKQAAARHVPPRQPEAPTFRLTSPLMKSARVADFQRLLNHRLAQWKVRYQVVVDGEYGPETRAAARKVAFGMGLSLKELEHGVTPSVRTRIRHPERRSERERAHATARRPWLRRLRRRYDGHGPASAIAYARKHLGVKEDPGRPNRGRIIDSWNRATGVPLNADAYWCGSFVNACLIAAGLPPDHVLAYCPSIEDRAQQGRDGWSWHATPQPGDLALFTHRYPDGRLDAGHVGIVEKVEQGAVITIEGNTSQNGISNNGYGVFRRRRTLPIRGFARPPYQH